MSKNKTFEVIVLIADGNLRKSGDAFSCEAISSLDFPKEVPVTRNFSRKIEDCVGRAKLTKYGNAVKAEINIFEVDKSKCNEKGEVIQKIIEPMVPEEMLHLIYPCIGGKVIEREGNVIKKFSIDQIGFSVSGNADSRIGPLCPKKN